MELHQPRDQGVLINCRCYIPLVLGVLLKEIVNQPYDLLRRDPSSFRAPKTSDEVLPEAASTYAVVMSAISERQRSTKSSRCSPSAT